MAEHHLRRRARRGPAPGGRARHRRAIALAIGLIVAVPFSIGAPPAPSGAVELEPPPGIVVRDDRPELPLDSRAKVNWGVVSGTVYFNPRETRNVSRMSTAAAVCGFFGGVPVAGPYLVAACGLQWATYVIAAQIAVDNYQCIKVKFGAGYATVPVFRYTGGYCQK